MRRRGLYEAPSVARCPPALSGSSDPGKSLGPAGGPARPAPARPRGVDGVARRGGAPARAAPARAGPVGGARAVGGAPARPAPARPGVVDLAGRGVDQVV